MDVHVSLYNAATVIAGLSMQSASVEVIRENRPHCTRPDNHFSLIDCMTSEGGAEIIFSL